ASIDLLCLGEMIVDFYPDVVGLPLREVGGFNMYQGGAPANVAIGAARLGRRVAMTSAVGRDEFGLFLLNALAEEGVNVESVRSIGEGHTPITFLSLDLHGERSFTVFRSQSSDRCFSPAHLDLKLISECQIMHFGSNFMTTEANNEATHCALDTALANGCLISFDANLRTHLWDNPKQAVTRTRHVLGRTHVVKVNDTENEMLALTTDPGEAFQSLYGPAGVQVLLVTHGAEGATLVTPKAHLRIPGRQVESVDTTGAGDAFAAALLAGMSMWAQHAGAEDLLAFVTNMDGDEWHPLLALANYAGSIVCTEYGATTAMPHKEQVPWEALGIPTEGPWVEHTEVES
ncbi:MAG: carbohydrate kinase, partial [Myxococcales bacterium]|nr:carbohydrate kinase [Myxococcales bacterium]